MRYWFTYDQILAIEPGVSAKAACNIPNTLSLFTSHFPRFPILPGVLLLDSLVHVGIHLLEIQTEQQWRLHRVKQVSFRHFVQPGDQLQLEVEVKQIEPMRAHLSGKVFAGGKCMATVRHIHLEVYQ
ncbi:3-hydroxyacyl-ACP dehydratase FabZ family protein [Tengunoibacter tsumagoiensis]|uniref:ApeI dehydratase-like domain-containing protein n=1 Tax=Tengunoibacter tsumagoiensis TaxID=2014871 RepID=A0A402A703_9CHLR|nr:3-hydroxyacyl-ACP dehydratase FabZ family protein [Tengunoibacter tsumagoiensis]GCE14920.1 hypothetical protein KTT_47790 [Tengunoibacter tsumagoiensis]